MKDDDDSSEQKPADFKPRWSWYRILLVAVPTLIPVTYFYLSGKERFTLTDLGVVGGMFIAYWLVVLFVAGRVLRHRQSLQSITLASPLIEVIMSPCLIPALSAALPGLTLFTSTPLASFNSRLLATSSVTS